MIPTGAPRRLADELRLVRDQSLVSPRSGIDSGSWITKEFSRKHMTEDVMHGYEIVLGVAGQSRGA